LDSSVIASPTGRARPLHWDGDAVSMTSGVTTTEARAEDRLEENLASSLRRRIQSGAAEGHANRAGNERCASKP
jgi:hypothetical protein